jgi:hypothetical protein
MADLTDSDDESTVVQEGNNQNGLRRGSRNRLPPESVRNYRNLMEARRDQMFESDDEDEDEDASSDDEEEDEDVAIDEEEEDEDVAIDEEDEDEPLMKGEEEAAPSPRRIDSIESQGNRNRQRTNTASEDEEEDHNVVNTSQQLSQASLKDGDEGNNIEADDSAMLPPPERPQQINDIDDDDDDDEQPRSIYDICTPNVIQDWITEHHEFDVNSIPAPRKVKGDISSIFDLSANLDYAAKSLFGREDRPYPNNTECLYANNAEHVKYLPKSDRVRAMMSRAMIPAHICNFPGMKRHGYLIRTENINLFLYPYVWKA